MSTFRTLGTILCAVLVGFSMTACGGDDETVVVVPGGSTDPTPTPTPTPGTLKKLIKIVEDEYDDAWSDRWTTTYLFDYDEEGRVDYAKKYDGNESISLDVSYDDNEIQYNYRKTYSYTTETFYGEASLRVSDGKLIFAVDDDNNATTNYNIEYNTAGHIAGWSWSAYSWGESTSFTWSGDKLVRSISGDAAAGKSDELYFKYSGKTCKAFNPMLMICYEDYLDNFLPLLAQPEWIGAKTTQIFDSYTEEDETCTLTYTMDADGYVKKCTAVWKESDGSIDERDVYTFTWE